MTRRRDRRPSRGRAFARGPGDPPILSGLALYLDPEWAPGLTNVGGDTQAVMSRVGGHTFSAPAAGQGPAFGAASLNGRFGWTFTPANSDVLGNLASTFAPLLEGLQPFTFYHVVDRDAVGAQHNLFATSDAAGAAGDCMHWGALNTNVDYFVRIDGGASTANIGAVAYPTGIAVETLVFDGATVSTWFNGVPYLAGAANTRALAAQTRAALGAIVLGGVYSLFFNGKLGKQLCYLAAHDATQRAAVEAWLRGLYAI
jgi:hypothetical protein